MNPQAIDVDLIVFDLDGTLADTVPDLTASVNFACRSLGLREYSQEEVKQMIGDGERKIIERALGPKHQDYFDEALRLYLEYYGRHNGDEARIFPEVMETLERVSHKTLAVLSNKLQHLTQQTMEAVGLVRFFKTIRGGGPGLPLKPAPDTLLTLIADLGATPSRTLMVGDKSADIGAGRGAGAFTAAITYGYGDLDSLTAASPDFFLPRFSQLPDILAG